MSPGWPLAYCWDAPNALQRLILSADALYQSAFWSRRQEAEGVEDSLGTKIPVCPPLQRPELWMADNHFRMPSAKNAPLKAQLNLIGARHLGVVNRRQTFNIFINEKEGEIVKKQLKRMSCDRLLMCQQDPPWSLYFLRPLTETQEKCSVRLPEHVVHAARTHKKEMFLD